jgi:murein DD-endopeptidase MepM/ murein hydrolase activator NlpD
MLTAKKKRGATAIRSEGKRLPRATAPHRRLVAVVVISVSACAALAIFLLPSKDEREAGTSMRETVLPATAPDASSASPPTSESPSTAEAEPTPAEQPWIEQTVRRGDNLSLIFKRAGFSSRDVHEVVDLAPDGKALSRIYPGQTIAFQAGLDGSLQGIRHTRSPLETAVYWRSESGFESRIDTRTPEPRQTWATGTIESSLFLAGQEAGLSQNLIMELANVFGGVIDFVLDPRVGDTIHLIYEELYLDGEKYKDGEIIAASFTNQGETYNAYRYEDTNGDVGYFNEEGVSMRKAFLLAPVDFTRISSNFNLRRLHPIYKTTRPHRGTDYAAPTGTPVYAAGDGRVIKAGYTRANGNYVFIQHGEQYVTRYLHLHKRRVKQGERVSQGQVIGTVGSTGAATGPHLHYEFLVSGVHRNPRTIHKQLPKAKSLPADELPRFRQAIGEATMQLASLRSDSQLALNVGAGEDPP